MNCEFFPLKSVLNWAWKPTLKIVRYATSVHAALAGLVHDCSRRRLTQFPFTAFTVFVLYKYSSTNIDVVLGGFYVKCTCKMGVFPPPNILLMCFDHSLVKWGSDMRRSTVCSVQQQHTYHTWFDDLKCIKDYKNS